MAQLYDLILPRWAGAFVRLLVALRCPNPDVGLSETVARAVAGWHHDHDRMCPEDMVGVGPACVDRLPWPNVPGEEPLLGTSAVPEAYLDLAGQTWDCEGLCSSVGKRLCTWAEWQDACSGTPKNACGSMRPWQQPDWKRVMNRDAEEFRRLDQHASADDHPECVSAAGVRLMTTVQEWVTVGDGYALSRGFWSREGGCNALNNAHAPNWHDYATACRCCMDARL